MVAVCPVWCYGGVVQGGPSGNGIGRRCHFLQCGMIFCYCWFRWRSNSRQGSHRGARPSLASKGRPEVSGGVEAGRQRWRYAVAAAIEFSILGLDEENMEDKNYSALLVGHPYIGIGDSIFFSL
jgi:hypothetical protein